jgi:predicted ATPase/DNA-binding SARP family transcriptional activator
VTAGSAASLDSAALDDVAPLCLHDLGTLGIEVGGEQHSPGGQKPARILSTLLVSANQRVSVDALILAVWGEQSFESSTSTLESHVWRLRKRVEPSRGRRQAPNYLVNDNGGYRLIVNPDNADSLRFAQLAEQGDDLLISGSIERALNLYDTALSLWRGRPYLAVADEDWAMAAVTRLEELFAQVQEQRVDALVRSGRHLQAITDLESLTAQFAFRERLWTHLMLALYRAARTEQALATYQRARALLLDGIGLEPGPEMREMHERILAQDDDLLLSRPTENQPIAVPSPREAVTPDAGSEAGQAPAGGGGGVYLPVRLSPLIGRETELARLTELIRRRRLLTLVGSAGCGKTRLAIDVARATSNSWPDGVRFLDLSATVDTATVLDAVVSGMGVAATPIGGAATALRTYVRDRQVLLVLDNCEHVIGTVHALLNDVLADAPECHVLATSREPIGIDGETLWTLAPLGTRDVPVSAEHASDPGLTPAAQLFVDKASVVDPTFELTDERREVVEAICSAVDGIPLAIELAAGQLRSAGLAEIRDRVEDDLGGLSAMGAGVADHHRTVDRSIDWSARRLTDAEAAAHARLSILPGVFTRESASAIASGDDVREVDVPDLLVRLVNYSLLTVVPPTRRGGATRFRQLATVRAHAIEALKTRDEVDDAIARRSAWLKAFVDARPDDRHRDAHRWHERLDDDHDALVATLQFSLVDAPDSFGSYIVSRLGFYWLYRGRVLEGDRWMTAAAQQDEAEPVEQAPARLVHAWGLAYRGRTDLAEGQIRAALAAMPVGETSRMLPRLLGIAIVARLRGAPNLDFAETEIHAMARNSPANETARLYSDLVTAYANHPTFGAEDGQRLEEMHQRALRDDDLFGAWYCALLACIQAVATGDPVGGARWAEANADYERLRGSALQLTALELKAVVAVVAEEWTHSATLLGEARARARRAGLPWPESPRTAAALQATREALNTEEFDTSWLEGERAADIVL